MESKHKKILLIPMIVLIIITLIAIVNVILQSTANADTSSGLCPNCKVQMEGPATPKSSSMCWSTVCPDCGYKLDRDHKYKTTYDSASSTGHRKVQKCEVCNNTIIEKEGHNYLEETCQIPTHCNDCGYTTGGIAQHAYINGKCKWCGKIQSIASSSSNSKNGTNNSHTSVTPTNDTCTHTWKYTSIYGQSKHKKTCTKCDISEITEDCKFTDNIISNGNSKTHTKVCDLCHGGFVQKCSPGAGSIQTKKPTCTTEGEAKIVCSICKGSWTEKIDKIAHTYENGVCIKCGKNECNHKNADGTSAYQISEYKEITGNYQTHNVTKKCTICGKLITSTEENHTYAVDLEGGRFACSKCKIVCPHNSFVDINTIKEATCNQDGQKREQCTICKFYQIVKIPKVSEHEYITKKTPATCTRDGSVSVECKYCGEKDYSKSYTIDAFGHDFSKATSEYIYKTTTQHARIYKCTRCNETTEEYLSDHRILNARDNKNGTHTGLCRVCNRNVTQAHEGGKHSNNGKCIICEEIYQNHGKSTTITSYKDITNIQHTAVYKCNYDDCNETYTGNSENHIITTWRDNGDETHSGTCATCKYIVTSNHTYKNGICTSCGAKENIKPVVCLHTYTMQKNETEHWKKCTKCGAEEVGSRTSHNVTSWNNIGNDKHSGNCTVCQYTVSANHTIANGKCTLCNFKEITNQEECKHNYVMQSDKNSHWEKCTICQKETAKSTHEITTWIDKKDGNHEGTCSVCKKVITEAHTNGASGTCIKCGYDGTSSGNNNGNDSNNNNNSGSSNNSNGNNSNNNGANNSNNENNSGTKGKDSTIANGKLPQTGVNNAIIVTVIALGLGTTVFSAKKIKGIKA